MKVKIDLWDHSQPENPRARTDLSDSRSLKKPVMKWSDDSARIGRVEIPIQKGMNLHIENIQKPIQKYNFEVDKAPIEFSIILTGRNRCAIRDRYGQKRIIESKAGDSVVSYLPNSYGTQECSNTLQTTIGIQIDPELLNLYINDEYEGLPKQFLDIINGSGDSLFLRSERLTRDIGYIAFQILNCSLRGVAGRIYYESKALELLALQIERFYIDPIGVSSSPSLSARDLEKTRHARELLVQSLESPPSLFELSKQVNLIHTKLNRGFRELYGKTVFEYLRAYRLDFARLQLLDNDKTISEIAFESGFSDASHFSRSFYKAYGIQPGKYRRSKI